MSWSDMLHALSLGEVIATYVAISLLVHYAFKRWEPSDIEVISLLLFGPPIPLSLLLQDHTSHRLYAVAASYVLHLVSLATSIVAYRLSPFHPLARYPGPLMCKVSKWWMVWQTRGGVQYLWVQQLHQKYGDAIRIGPNELSFRDPSIIAPFLGATGLPKGPARRAAGLYPEVNALIMFRDPVEHARRRKPWTRAFNVSALKDYQPKIVQRASELVEKLSSQEGVTDLSLWMSYFAYDFMGDMAFGGGSAMMQKGDGDALWKVLKDGFVGGLLFEQVSWLPYIAKFFPATRERVANLRDLGISRARSRFEAGSQTKDLFYYLSNEDGAEKQSPPKHIVVSDGALAVVAGSDTTANALSSAFWCLLTHPDVYKQLQEEVDKFYPPESDSTNPEHHPKMVLLEAVINEAMRLFPPVPSGSQRAPLVGGGDRTIGQYYIPEGTCARIHTYSLHRDPRNFSHPDTFWPARWLIADGLEATKEGFVHNASAFIPFSYGVANCVGKGLAMQEMRIVLCHIMQKLELKLADDWAPAEFKRAWKDYFVTVVGKLPVIVTPRKC